MIRYTLLTLAVLFLVGLAWRDWYKSLCGLIVFMAIIERSDMPTHMFGVPGLNPWNVIMLSVLLSWLVSRRSEMNSAPVSRVLRRLGVLYFVIVMISVCRMLLDSSSISPFFLAIGEVPLTWSDLFIDYVINSFKWIVPALLLFSGCNSKSRWKWAIAAISLTCILFAVQVINFMPIGSLVDGTQLQHRANRVLGRSIGYHRVDLAALLASATWIFYLLRDVKKELWFRTAMVILATVCFIALLLTGGRAGLAACVVVGAVFAAFRWRKLLILAPIVFVIAMAALPAVKQRVMEGLSEESYESGISSLGVDTIDDAGRDMYAITSGRVLVWPFVIEKISERPIIGFGQKAMLREGVSLSVMEVYGRQMAFGHPHNAYLELLLDTGIIGTIPILMFFSLVLLKSIQAFNNRSSLELSITGGICLAFVLAQLVASIGSQSFTLEREQY